MDETWAYYTEWSKSERETPIQYIIAPCFLTAPPLFLHSLHPSLTWYSTVWSALWKAEEAEWSLLPTNKKQDMERVYTWEGPTGSCSAWNSLFFDTPHSSRNRNKDKNGNKVLNIEVKYSLSKGTVLPRNFKFLAHSELMSKKETLSFNLTWLIYLGFCTQLQWVERRYSPTTNNFNTGRCLTI